MSSEHSISPTSGTLLFRRLEPFIIHPLPDGYRVAISIEKNRGCVSISWKSTGGVFETANVCIASPLARYLRLLFIHAMEATVGIRIGHTSMQDRDFEQSLPKCAPYIPAISRDLDWFLAATR